MPFLKVQDTITITASGGSFTLDTTASTEIYNIIGTATMISNVTIAPINTAITGLTYVFNYKAILDITTNSTSVTIFGQALTAPQALNSQEILCTYNGSTWDVDIQSSFDDSNIVSTSNIQNNAITSSKIAPGAISTSSLADDSVTNAKLATMTVSSVKIGDASGNPADLALANNEIPIGNGTTVTTINKSASFESGEQSANIIKLPFAGFMKEAYFCVTKVLSATDNGTINFKYNTSPFTSMGILTVPLSSAVNDTVSLTFTPSTWDFVADDTIMCLAAKTTVGGKGILSLIVERVI
jgi:hypothetical protein